MNGVLPSEIVKQLQDVLPAQSSSATANARQNAIAFPSATTGSSAARSSSRTRIPFAHDRADRFVRGHLPGMVVQFNS
jgi:hypothetical protein